ncbi:MAG TPA: metal ABC transporter permease [bacterium]|nr:metal ABC transporter permease [bacterium]HPS29275.1 metal ABC transporter permease [bacterium]
MDFFNALLSYSFLQYAVAASLLSALSCGISGTFVYINRITFIAGGIAHAVLGGVGAAVYFGFNPFAGAVTAALLFALILGIIKFKASAHEDTVIGALWACGMSAGIIFIYLTPGYAVNLNSYLFGNILLVSKQDLVYLSILALTVFLISTVLFRQFCAVSFDDEFASLRGIKSHLIYILLLAMIALTVVVLMKVVGLILVIAFLSLPSATSAIFFKKISSIIAFSILLSFIFSMTGLAVSYKYDLPTGASITIVSGAVYIISLVMDKMKTRG